MRETYHLVPRAIWEARDPEAPYEAESLTTEGFVHCTDGKDELIVVANRYYATDPRPFLAVTLDLDRVVSPWRFDVPGSPYPHIYGPIAAAAVIAVAPLERHRDGRFVRLAAPETAASDVAARRFGRGARARPSTPAR